LPGDLGGGCSHEGVDVASAVERRLNVEIELGRLRRPGDPIG
jgi:hypothetical protein